ncbi:MAG: divalent-cation tolerance protein CutA [Pseudomonadota bacterium]|nr:divalent-cation tolerance protein CutA [Pseudomonadota bacterium]
MTANVLLTFCTCPDDVIANRIAETLVRERHAACVNRLSGVTSFYRWQGELQRDEETLLLIKTTTARFDALSARLRELHPYELPEIIAVPVDRGLPEYLQWVSTCTADTA